MTVAQPDGRITHAGGRVVKNVSGYDMARLHVGGLGTLGIIAEASFKLTPLPARRATVLATFDSARRSFEAALAVFSSGVVPPGYHRVRQVRRSREWGRLSPKRTAISPSSWGGGR